MILMRFGDLNADPSRYMPSRYPGVRLPLEIMPTFKVGEGGVEKGGYAVYAPDGTVIAKYPPEEVLLVKFAAFLRQQRDLETYWMLERFIRHLKRKNLAWEEDIPIHRPAVHPFHVRYAPADEDARRFSSLVRLAENRLLLNPLIVTPSGTGDLDYFVIDGFRRLVAAYEAFSSDLGSWKGVPTIPSIVIRGRKGISMDVLSAVFLSLALNVSNTPDLVERLPPNLRDGLRQLARVLGIQLDRL
jgi:hypothetical protein